MEGKCFAAVEGTAALPTGILRPRRRFRRTLAGGNRGDDVTGVNILDGLLSLMMLNLVNFDLLLLLLVLLLLLLLLLLGLSLLNLLLLLLLLGLLVLGIGGDHGVGGYDRGVG